MRGTCDMSDVMEHYQDDGLHEECGVFGMYDFDGHDVARTIYYGLFALQHRGQESCGIAVSDTEGPKGKVLSSKGMGLVNEVFTQEDLDKLKGNIGVGHVRYSTAGASTRENAQPLVLNYIKGTLALAHNGNLVNAPELRRELAHDGAIFQTTIDSEVIAYHIARERVKTSSAEEAVQNAMKKLVGSYSLIVMSPRKLIVPVIRLGSVHSASENATMRTCLHRKAAHLIQSVQNLFGMWNRVRWLLYHRKKGLKVTESCARRNTADVCLNIFILQDRTVILTG